MRQQTRRALNLTADHAARALHALITDGKLAIRDVTTALSRRRKLMKELKDRFTELETGGTARPAEARKATAPKAARKRPRTAARAKVRARSTVQAAGKTKRKKTVARAATRRKTSVQKAAASAATPKKPARRPSIAARPRPVRMMTRKVTPSTATTAAAPKRRPATVPASIAPTPAPAPKTEGTLPNVVNPEHEGGAAAPRNLNPI